jgi:antirestriction protein ArdC
MFASEPDKPTGIGSKSKDKKFSDHIMPLYNEADQILKRLVFEIKSQFWSPTLSLAHAYEAHAALIKSNRIFKDAVTRSKNRAFREAAIHEGLIQTLGNKTKATKALRDLLSEMNRVGFVLSSSASGWEGRVRQFYKSKDKRHSLKH